MPEAAADDRRIVEHCRSVMRSGSLSFFFAARLLGRRLRDAVIMLYAWCRHCDDAIDTATNEDPRRVAVILDGLRAATWGSLRQRPPRGQPVFEALALLARKTRLPDYYLQELLSGMEMDLVGQRYRTLQDLDLYCYRVAGVVGLMFSHLSGVSDTRALQHAADLGKAMQLTNIARDVIEDKAMGRVYLPDAWLEAEGIPRDELDRPQHRVALARVVARLLDRADELYRSGETGLGYLPIRAALAVAVARSVYGEIGHLVRARGPAAWDRRAVVPLSRKLALLPGSVLAALRRSRQTRRSKSWRPVSLDGILLRGEAS